MQQRFHPASSDDQSLLIHTLLDPTAIEQHYITISTMAPSAVAAEQTVIPETKQLVSRNKDDVVKELTPLQAISQGVCLPGIPLFSSYDKHRAWILSHMAGMYTNQTSKKVSQEQGREKEKKRKL